MTTLKFDKIKAYFLGIFKPNSPKKGPNKFEVAKRNRLIKKMRSNAIAIVTNQIGIHSGSMKMNNFIDIISEIETLENINLEVFEDFYSAFAAYPIEKEKQYYNKEFLAQLDSKLKLIDDEYKPQIIEKCKEIIEKFEA